MTLKDYENTVGATYEDVRIAKVLKTLLEPLKEISEDGDILGAQCAKLEGWDGLPAQDECECYACRAKELLEELETAPGSFGVKEEATIHTILPGTQDHGIIIVFYTEVT
jgi:hypothetical protein